uniref:Uncharacterized protein n=1 Tax=Sphaerodactylus townsendi TaxID=933632 RepID=A0ACB8F921_9SAUR
MQFQAPVPMTGPPLYAPTPLLQPVHPTPFYIDNILGGGSSSRGTPGPPPPTLPSPNSSFTSLVASYRTPIYEPTPLHPAFSHPLASYAPGPYGAPAGGPLYPFPRALGDYSHALLRPEHLARLVRSLGGPGRSPAAGLGLEITNVCSGCGCDPEE